MSDNTQRHRDVGEDVQNSISGAAELFNLLGNERRIRVLRELSQRDNKAFLVADIADSVAKREFGDGFGSEQRRSVYVALYQCHLLRLGEGCLISYNQDSAVIRRGSKFEQAMDVLDGVLRTGCM